MNFSRQISVIALTAALVAGAASCNEKKQSASQQSLLQQFRQTV